MLRIIRMKASKISKKVEISKKTSESSDICDEALGQSIMLSIKTRHQRSHNRDLRNSKNMD